MTSSRRTPSGDTTPVRPELPSWVSSTERRLGVETAIVYSREGVWCFGENRRGLRPRRQTSRPEAPSLAFRGGVGCFVSTGVGNGSPEDIQTPDPGFVVNFFGEKKS